MTTFEQSPLGRLDQEGRILNAVLKGPTPVDGRIGYRGDFALKFQVQVADEKRPPALAFEQIVAYTDNEKTFPVLAGYLHSFANLPTIIDVLGDALAPEGTYLIFCNNIDLRAKYKVKFGDITLLILPCDESTVWKEMTDILGVEKHDLKGLDTAGKTDFVLDALKGFDDGFKEITFEEGLELMEPERNRYENRPV